MSNTSFSASSHLDPSHKGVESFRLCDCDCKCERERDQCLVQNAWRMRILIVIEQSQVEQQEVNEIDHHHLLSVEPSRQLIRRQPAEPVLVLIKKSLLHFTKFYFLKINGRTSTFNKLWYTFKNQDSINNRYDTGISVHFIDLYK